MNIKSGSDGLHAPQVAPPATTSGPVSLASVSSLLSPPPSSNERVPPSWRLCSRMIVRTLRRVLCFCSSVACWSGSRPSCSRL